MEQNAGNNGSLITLDAAKSKISIALTRSNLLVQTFATRASNLILNEDGLEEIRQFLSDKRQATKITEETHKIIKAPFFEAGKACDGAKNAIIGELDAVAKPIEVAFNRINDEINRKKREAEAKAENDRQIKAGVESNILSFATKIAASTTRKDLNDVERLINLEKSPSRATKYGGLHEYAKSRYDEVLIPVLKDQKVKVDEYEKIQEQLSKADNPNLADELKEKLEEKENEIAQNQIKVQEDALNQQSIPSAEAEQMFPDVTSAGSNMVCEIVDEKTVYKKHRELLNVELKLADAKKLGTTLRDAGAFAGKDELIFDGIKFKIERRWK
jgi:hypothetical protein